jgi:hypothetical protein
MRLRALLVVVLILLCVRMSGRAPAAGPRPGSDRAPPGPQKVYPFSLRYRQQIEQQVRFRAPVPPAVPAVRPADHRSGRHVEPAAFLPAGPAQLSLLVRLQP